MKKVKLIKSWMGHKSGTLLEVDEATLKTILDEKVGEEVNETSNKEIDTAKIEEVATKAATAAVEKTLKEMAKDSTKMIHIQVKDLSDEDPTFGYLPECRKSLKDLTTTREGKDAVNYAFGHFARDVYRATSGAGQSEKLMKCRERGDNIVNKAAGDGMLAGSDEAGGYLIFSAASALIQAQALEDAIVRPRANRVTMGTQLLRIPYLQDTIHSTGYVYGGITVYFQDENAAATESKPKLEQLEFKLKKMVAMGYASEEWIKFSPVSLGSWLIPKFGEAVAWKEDLSFLIGKGGAQPLGVINATNAISISKETNQDASTFVVENSTKMFARLRVRKNASVCWLMNRNVFPQLPLFNITAGAGGAPVFVNIMNGGAQNAPGQSLWGIPIVWTEKIPALGTAGCVMLVDFSDYIVADDQTGPSIAQSIHLKFDLGQTAFRITKYIDGQNETPAALTPVSGDTLSPVIKHAAT